MSDGRNVIYLYDGTFYGLLTVIFECYSLRTIPYNIQSEENVQQTIFCEYETIETSNEKAERVEKSIYNKISKRALYAIFLAYLSNLPDKEITIFNFIMAGFKIGKNITNYLTLDCVNHVINSAKTVFGEMDLLRGFVRFSKLNGGIYYAKITPKNNVLPILEPHFTERYRSMPFIIHDTVRNQCLVYNGKNAVIRETGSLPKIELSDDENEYRKLWKCFFDTIEIKERHNERCQKTHLPLRYRENMTEFQTPAH